MFLGTQTASDVSAPFSRSFQDPRTCRIPGC